MWGAGQASAKVVTNLAVRWQQREEIVFQLAETGLLGSQRIEYYSQSCRLEKCVVRVLTSELLNNYN